MSKIVNEIKNIIDKNMKQYLPHIDSKDLEEDGKIYYMNGKNGTEFDWYVNQHISNFMIFYNDTNKLGAIKLTLYKDRKVLVYIYDEKGTKLIKEVNTYVDADETEIFELVVKLRNVADDNRIWDSSIDSINLDIKVTREMIKEFRDNRKYYENMINKMTILTLNSYVSKKIIEEGWKIGYMERTEPINEKDSGWAFMLGDEDDEYVSDPKNIELISVGYVWKNLDPDIFNYIDSPIGTKLIRISSNKFEIDNKNKEIFFEKR